MKLFSKIEEILKPLQTAQGHQTENKLRSELRPTPLTINSSLSEVITFLRNFSTYIQSGNGKSDQLPEGIIFEVVKTNVDSFWIKMLEGWGFGEKTKLQEFITMINTISKNRFSICDRRLQLFGLKQTNEDPVGFLAKVNDLVKNADWYNISENEATLLIFQQGINCAQSKKICSEFIKTKAERDVEKLADQLTGLKISNKPTPTKPNSTNCGRAGQSSMQIAQP